VQPALATKLPSDLLNCLKTHYSEVKTRLDGSVEINRTELLLPLLPTAQTKPEKVTLTEVYPPQGKSDMLVFSNGWCFLRVLKRGLNKTIVNPHELPENLLKLLLSGHFATDLIVPEKFTLPRRLKVIAKDISVTYFDEAPRKEEQPLVGQIKPPSSSRGVIFVTSPSTGKIALLDDQTFVKQVEFPTEGTPNSLAVAEHRLYITDQSKNRILIIEPKQRKFLGQIDLPAKTTPKGIAALPNGKLLYVSEYAANNIDVIETENNKVLVRTKVPAGPSRLAITPDGLTVIVMNAPAGRVTMISAATQKVLGSVVVGTLPNGIVINRDSSLAYVSNRVSNSVSIIDIASRKVTGTMTTGTGPTGLALDSVKDRLYVANARDNSLSVFDTRTRKKIEDIKLPLDIDFPGGVMLTPDGKRLLVSSTLTDAIGILDTQTLKFDSQPVIGHSTDQMLWIPIE
jgi:YVTN family beta-propeller protein